MFCGKCGTQVENSEKFCGSCGAVSNQQPVVQTNQANQTMVTQTPKATNNRLIGIIACAVVLVIVIIGAVAIFGGGGLSGKYVSTQQTNNVGDRNYIQFSGGNKVFVYDHGLSFNGTYEINGDRLIIRYMALGYENRDDFTLSSNRKSFTGKGYISGTYVKK